MNAFANRIVRGAVVLALFAWIPVEALAKRVALVIGNSAYEHSVPLRNPRNDAEAIAAKLRSLGFETVEGYDLDMMAMGGKAREFARAAKGADLALFFYAGHGMQADGTNYLVPVDAALEDVTAIDFELFPIDVITRQMSYTDGANLIILDACRDNPMATQLARASSSSSRSVKPGGGLSEMGVTDSGFGTGIVFATAPEETAADGNGQHSPFTQALLSHIGTANLPFSSVMNRVTGDVYESTEQQQRPWFNASFTGDVILNAVEVSAAAPAPAAVPQGEQVAAAAPAPAPSGDEARAMLEFAQQVGTAEAYQTVVDLYPGTPYAIMAGLAIDKLQAEQVAASRSMAEPAAPDYDPDAPLSLQVTPQLRAMPASAGTEQLLNMDRSKRREVQARLNASGHNVGTPDGAFGPNTRRGITGWQVAHGLPQSGYLNMAQLSLLTSETEATYASHMPTVSRASGGGSGGARKSSGGGNVGEAVKGFFTGLGAGIGSNIGR